MYVSLNVPPAPPNYGDAYYVLLSVWDTNGNYDQLGLASWYCAVGEQSGCNGVTGTDAWAIIDFEGYTNSNCPPGTSATYGPHLFWNYLSVHSTVTLEMNLASSNLNYKVYNGVGTGGTLLWSDHTSDNAANFYIEQTESTYSCWSGGNYYSGSIPGTQLYEEVFNINPTHSNQQMPPWDFQYYQMYDSGSGVIPDSSWTEFSSSAPTNPNGYWADFTQGTNGVVRIANEAFWLSWSSDSASIAPGGTATYDGNVEAIGSSSPTDYCVTNTCTISTSYCSAPSGWTSSSYTLGSSSVPLWWDNSLVAPSGTSPGVYVTGCWMYATSSSPQEESWFGFWTTVT